MCWKYLFSEAHYEKYHGYSCKIIQHVQMLLPVGETAETNRRQWIRWSCIFCQGLLVESWKLQRFIVLLTWIQYFLEKNVFNNQRQKNGTVICFFTNITLQMSKLNLKLKKKEKHYLWLADRHENLHRNGNSS